MNHHIMLFPLLGMEFNGRSIRFSDRLEMVEGVLGAAESVHGRRRYYFGSELALDFDAEGRLNFIEFLGGPEGELQPDLYGHLVFQTEADEVLELFRGRGAQIVDEDGDYTFTVPSLSVGLYREISPTDVEELIRAMAKMDVTTLGHVDLAAEQRRASHWETIGLGKKHYYA